MGAPSPTAKGVIARTSVAEILIHAALRSLTGTIVFENGPTGKCGLVLCEGVPSKLQTPVLELRLGQLLLGSGLISAEQLQQALATPHAGPLGERLIHASQLQPSQLTAALERQLASKLKWLAALPDSTVFAVYEQHDLLARWPEPSSPHDVLPSIWIAAQHLDRSRCTALLDEYRHEPLALHPRAEPERFGFQPELTPLLQTLRRGDMSYDALLQAGFGEGDEFYQSLFALSATRHLISANHTAWPLGVSEVSSKPVSGPIRSQRLSLQPVVEALDSLQPAPNAQVLDASLPPSAGSARQAYARRLEAMTHYEVLQLSRAASSGDVAGAFLRLAKTWHPDRVGSADPADREAATRVFARLNEAHRTLSHEQTRRSYDEALDGSGSALDEEQELVMQVLSAAHAFQKALVLVRKRDYEGARQLAAEATAADPEQAEYPALLAWIEAHLPAHRDSGDYSKQLAELLSAVERQPRNPRIHQYRADVLNRAGEAEAALREYEWVAQREPNNVEVAREIRLYHIRQQKPAEARGLLSRWLKR